MIEQPKRKRSNHQRPKSKKPSRVKQSFKYDADPNRLMKAYNKSGKKDLFEQTNRIAMHGDFSNIPDFFNALLQVQEVKAEFDELPIEVRRATHNSPLELFEMLSDPDKVEQCIELGLREKDAEGPLDIPTPEKTEPVPETAQSESPVQGGE